MDIKDYLDLLPQWLKHYGLEKADAPNNYEVEGVYKRSRVEVSKLGNVDTYCVVKYVKEGATGDYLRSFSNWAYDFAYNNRTGAPVGLFSMLVTYPLLIVEGMTGDLQEGILNYCPKHFAAAEFPSVLDLTADRLYFYPKTPVWGYAYYGNYRNESTWFFSPSSWKELGAGK